MLLDEEKDNSVCRICFSIEDPYTDSLELFSPCICKGSMKYVHKACLRTWRFRAKRIEEIRRCEQCLTIYNVEDEIVPHVILVRATSILLVMLLYVVVHIIGNLFFEAIHIITEEVSFDAESNKFINGTCLGIKSTYGSNRYKELGFTQTFAVLALIYQVIKKKSIVSIFNYLFTMWRIFYFDYFVDYTYIGFLSLQSLYRMLKDINIFVDSILVYVLNFK